MQLATGYLEALKQRLESDGCTVHAQRSEGRQLLVARRADFRLRWMATRLHLFTLASVVPVVSPAEIEAFTAWAQDYAIGQKGGLPRGAQTGVAVFPTLISEAVDPQAARWAAAKQRLRFACLGRPVVVDARTGGASCFRGIAAMGFIYGGHLRRKLDQYFPVEPS